MTVKELIERLQTLDGDLPVVVQVSSERCISAESIDVHGVVEMSDGDVDWLAFEADDPIMDDSFKAAVIETFDVQDRLQH